jgi:hypothetical protein
MRGRSSTPDDCIDGLLHKTSSVIVRFNLPDYNHCPGMSNQATRHSIDLIQSTIVIHEDDLPDISPAVMGVKRPMRRCISVPETLWDIRSVMKIRTLDESIHSTYAGSESGTRGSIRFKSVGIREYARTVGDNPSCSSGPPVR